MSSQPVLVAAPRIAWTAYTLPPYILNMCISALPMKKSKPTPIPVSASAKIECDLMTLPVGSPDWQLAPRLQPPGEFPFSRRLQFVSALHTPAGNALKYLLIQAFISLGVLRIASGTGVSHITLVSLMMIASGFDG